MNPKANTYSGRHLVRQQEAVVASQALVDHVRGQRGALGMVHVLQAALYVRFWCVGQ